MKSTQGRGSGYLGGGAQSSWVAADGRYWFVGCRDYPGVQKQITVGSLFGGLAITHPMPNNEIIEKLLSSVVRIFVIVS